MRPRRAGSSAPWASCTRAHASALSGLRLQAPLPLPAPGWVVGDAGLPAGRQALRRGLGFTRLGRMRRRRRLPPSGPKKATGRESDAGRLRRRGQRPGPREAGGCSPAAGGREPSRRKRMVTWASEREEVESDESGEASGAGRPRRGDQ